MGSHWELNTTPCARCWGGVRHARRARHACHVRHPWDHNVPGMPGAPEAPRVPQTPGVPHTSAGPGAALSDHVQRLSGVPAH
eukprot:6241838-Pyramimonas_sp.AAC.1